MQFLLHFLCTLIMKINIIYVVFGALQGILVSQIKESFINEPLFL